MIKPFAEDGGAYSIGDLTAENGPTAVSISGSVDVTRDKEGLERARALRSLADTLVRSLETVTDLPERAPQPAKAGDYVPNPFA